MLASAFCMGHKLCLGLHPLLETIFGLSSHWNEHREHSTSVLLSHKHSLKAQEAAIMLKLSRLASGQGLMGDQRTLDIPPYIL